MSFFRRKNMKKYTYRKFLILLFMINLIAITAVYIKYCNANTGTILLPYKNRKKYLRKKLSNPTRAKFRRQAFELFCRSEILFSFPKKLESIL